MTTEQYERRVALDFEEFDRRKEATKLKPAQNLRRIIPRCCATCAYHVNIEGSGMCFRQGGYQGDEGDLDAFFTVCDLYKQESCE